MNEQDIYNALKEAYRRAKTQAALAKKAHLSQGRIADYLNKRYCIGNMTCSTLLRLFPEMQISFFSDAGLSVSDQSDRSDQSEKSDNRVCQDTLRRALQKAETKKAEYEHKVEELAREKADLENARKYLEPTGTGKGELAVETGVGKRKKRCCGPVVQAVIHWVVFVFR